jgi:hypothetical protein
MDRFAPMVHISIRFAACTAVVTSLMACSSTAVPSPAPTTGASASASYSSSAAPRPTTASSAHVTTVPSPSEVENAAIAPSRPKALEAEPSEEAAEAVGIYFLKLFPYVNATGDVAVFKVLSDRRCKFCASVLSGVKEATNLGHRDVGGAISLEGVQTRTTVDGKSYTVFIDLVQSASRTVDESGATVKRFPGPKGLRATLVVHRSASRWTVRGVQIDPRTK